MKQKIYLTESEQEILSFCKEHLKDFDEDFSNLECKDIAQAVKLPLVSVEALVKSLLSKKILFLESIKGFDHNLIYVDYKFIKENELVVLASKLSAEEVVKLKRMASSVLKTRFEKEDTLMSEKIEIRNQLSKRGIFLPEISREKVIESTEEELKKEEKKKEPKEKALKKEVETPELVKKEEPAKKEGPKKPIVKEESDSEVDPEEIKKILESVSIRRVKVIELYKLGLSANKIVKDKMIDCHYTYIYKLYREIKAGIWN